MKADPTFSERVDMDEARKVARKLMDKLGDFTYLARAGLTDDEIRALEVAKRIAHGWWEHGPRSGAERETHE